ncbi:MAG: GDP-mannose-dependent alpha-(1-6)-phosphatidylinositol monomannoside mannosyltransferase [Frankiales bacterium]|nr:GDP-mannose-dependent alpha-(1-6)-phosphatidylinositol monomannoside mannosyltransferase [Frankiales bacterium]
MSHPLAVCVPVVGQGTESFIRRHVTELLPGRTVVIARRPAPPGTGTWATDAPTLWLDPLLDEWGGDREQAAVRDFLHEHGVRAVLAEYLDIWLPFLPTFAGAGVRCVAHAHGYDVSVRLREEHWRTAYLGYRHTAEVVTMSECSRTRLVNLGLEADQVQVVPYGVDVPASPDRPQREQVHVLAVGRLVGKKSPLTTLEACRRAAASGAQLRVTVVGDGPLRAELEQAAAASGLTVELPGAQPHGEVLAAMRDADVFAQHSVTDAATGDEEGLPVAILEAMAHGLPVVSTRHAGIPEAVVEGVTGFLVDEGDVDAMADRLATLAADGALRQRFGAAGRQIVLDRFTWAAERAGLLAVLQLQTERVRT